MCLFCHFHVYVLCGRLSSNLNCGVILFVVQLIFSFLFFHLNSYAALFLFTSFCVCFTFFFSFFYQSLQKQTAVNWVFSRSYSIRTQRNRNERKKKMKWKGDKKNYPNENEKIMRYFSVSKTNTLSHGPELPFDGGKLVPLLENQSRLIFLVWQTVLCARVAHTTCRAYAKAYSRGSWLAFICIRQSSDPMVLGILHGRKLVINNDENKKHKPHHERQKRKRERFLFFIRTLGEPRLCVPFLCCRP